MVETLTLASYDDVFDLFIRDEEEAIESYDRFARSSRKLELKKMFEQIGRDEIGHLTALKHMWKKYSGRQFTYSLEVKINQKVYDDATHEFNSYEAILKYVAEEERNAEKLYLDIANKIPDDEAKQLFLTNAREEEIHRHRIEKMMHYV